MSKFRKYIPLPDMTVEEDSEQNTIVKAILGSGDLLESSSSQEGAAALAVMTEERIAENAAQVLKLRSPFFLGFESTIVEEQFIIFLYLPRTMMVMSGFMLYGLAYITIAAIYNYLAHEWMGYAQWTVGVSMCICSGFVYVLCVRPSRVTEAEKKRVAMRHEMFLFIYGILAQAINLFVYTHKEICVERFRKKGQEIDIRTCIQAVNPYILMTLFCFISCFIIRGKWGVPFALLSPGVVFMMRPLTPPLDSTNNVIAQVIIIEACAIAVIMALLTRESSFRKQFVQGITLKALARKAKAQQVEVDRLLHLLLPESIVHRLSAGTEIVDMNRQGAVCICEIHDFAKWSTTVLPQDILQVLATLFRSFDCVRVRASVEKIKTIGDRYIATSGVQEPCELTESALRITRFALKAILVVNNLRRVISGAPKAIVAVHIGELMGAIVGSKSLSYDIFGSGLIDALSILRVCNPQVLLGSETICALLDPPVAHHDPFSQIIFQNNNVHNVYEIFECKSSTDLTQSKPLTLSSFEALNNSVGALDGPLNEFPTSLVADGKLSEGVSAALSRSSNIGTVKTDDDDEVVKNQQQAFDVEFLRPVKEERLTSETLEVDLGVVRHRFLVEEALKKRVYDPMLDNLRLDTGTSEFGVNVLINNSSSQNDDVDGLSPTHHASSHRVSTTRIPLFGRKLFSAISSLVKEQESQNPPLSFRYTGCLESQYDEFITKHGRNEIISAYFVILIMIVGSIISFYFEEASSPPIIAIFYIMIPCLAARGFLQYWKPPPRFEAPLSFLVIMCGVVTALSLFPHVTLSNSNVYWTFGFLTMSIVVCLRNGWVVAACIGFLTCVSFIISMYMYSTFSLAALVGIPILWVATILAAAVRETANRAHFESILMSRSLLRVTVDEFHFHEAVLGTLLPPHVVPIVHGMSGTVDDEEAYVQHYADLVTLEIRVDTFASRIAKMMRALDADAYLVAVDDVVRSVQAAVQFGNASVQEKRSGATVSLIRVMGDRFFLAGPLDEQSENLVDNEEGLAYGIVAMLNVIGRLTVSGLSSGGGRDQHLSGTNLSLVCNAGTGYGVVVGCGRVSFDVLGVAQRQTSSLLDAAPPGYCGVTHIFVRSIELMPDHVKQMLPNYELSQHQSWGVRGVGKVIMHQIKFQDLLEDV